MGTWIVLSDLYDLRPSGFDFWEDSYITSAYGVLRDGICICVWERLFSSVNLEFQKQLMHGRVPVSFRLLTWTFVQNQCLSISNMKK